MTLELAAVAILAGLLVVVSAVAGALWFRARSVPVLRATLLARDLIERLRVLEAIIERSERAEAARQRSGAEPRPVGPPATDAPRLPRIGTALRIDREGPVELAPLAGPEPEVCGADPDAGPRPVETGPTLIAVPDLSAASGEPDSVAGELAGRFGAIWSLAERGESAEAIARASGLPIGQVELILGLRRRTGAAR